MDNNINNHNNNEIPKGQTPENNRKANDSKPVNRIKKKNPNKEEIQSTASKKIPLSINKNVNSPEKSSHKGQVIKLENKENKAPSRVQNDGRPVQRTNASSSNTINSFDDILVRETPPDYSQNRKVEKGSFKFSANTGKLLLVVAAIAFIAWAVIFFYYHLGGNTHMLLALAIICAVISLVGSKNK